LSLGGAESWSPERLLSVVEVQALVDSSCPELAPCRARAFAEGWDNSAFLVNDAWIFRFPRRQVAVAGLECETRLLPFLAPRLPLALPRPSKLGLPGLGFPWPFAGYLMLPGQTLCRADLGEEARGAMAESLGHFLRALHALKLPEDLQTQLPADPFGRSQLKERAHKLCQRLDRLDLNAEAHELPLVEARRLLKALENIPPRETAPVLVHGDLYARHLLVDDQGTLTGVIDWGDLQAGDPGLDLSIARSVLPASARQRFFQAYGAVDPRTLGAARFQALSYGIILSLFGREIRDKALIQAGERALLGALEA